MGYRTQPYLRGDAFANALRTPGPRFIFFFAAWLVALATLFESMRAHWVDFFMYPLTRAAALTLNALGFDAHLAGLDPVVGVCQLVLENVVYLVSFECTGIFALFMCVASVMAFPANGAEKIRGLGMVLPAFVCYSILRMVVLGIVAHFAPQLIHMFHVYVMVVVNIGFVLMLWLHWVHDLSGGSSAEAV